MTSIRLLTFNIAHGRGLSLYQGFHSRSGIERNLNRIAELFREQAPDIAALQEVDVRSHWNCRINLLAHIKKAAGYSHAQEAIHTTRAGSKELAYGTGILSRFPITRSSVHPFGSRKLGEKGYQFAEIHINGLLIPLVNLHLDYRSRKRRIIQVEQLIAWLAENRSACTLPIICGDFNSTSKAETDAVQHLYTAVSTFDRYSLHPTNAATFPAQFPLRSLDFILLPSRFHMQSCSVVKCYLSDHRPVLIEFNAGPNDETNLPDQHRAT